MTTLKELNTKHLNLLLINLLHHSNVICEFLKMALITISTFFKLNFKHNLLLIEARSYLFLKNAQLFYIYFLIFILNNY